MDNVALILNQGISGAATAYIVEFLTHSKLCPFINEESVDSAKRWFCIIVAAATTAGLSYHFEPSTRMFSFYVPTPLQFIHWLWDFVKVLGAQNFTYQTAIKGKKL